MAGEVEARRDLSVIQAAREFQVAVPELLRDPANRATRGQS
jgi:hypothetical protein